MSKNTFEVYALKYATRVGARSENFHGGDPHDAPMRMDYYVWALISPDLTVVVDTGFTPEVAQKRGRTHLRCPAEALASLGIEASSIPMVILTHLHYDHIGNLDMFPAATFVVQEEEIAFWTGRYASRGHFRHHIEVEDVVWLARENFSGRLRFVSGSERLAPGVAVHRVGGHSAGLQIAEVETAKGTVVVASDACHFYENIERDRPFGIVSDVPEMYGAFDVVNTLAETDDCIIPGHDPLVMERFDPVHGLEGVAVRVA